MSSPLSFVPIQSSKPGATQLIWGHGWGQSHAAWVPLAESLRPFASSILIDFPGFGNTPLPPTSWGTAEYADQVADWLAGFPPGQSVWIGHSFGGRVGLQLAARHPHLLKGMVLIAAAGLPRQRTAAQCLRMALRRGFFKAAKQLLRNGPRLDRLRDLMGSADYRNAGPLRPIFTRVVNENLSGIAAAVRCPTLLLYGERDTETPPEIGRRLHKLIPNSQLAVLEGFGHLDILTTGRHQVASRIRTFLESLPQ